MKKNVKILYLIIGILACLIVVLGVLVFNKITNDKKESNKENNNKVTEKYNIENCINCLPSSYELEIKESTSVFKLLDAKIDENDRKIVNCVVDNTNKSAYGYDNEDYIKFQLRFDKNVKEVFEGGTYTWDTLGTIYLFLLDDGTIEYLDHNAIANKTFEHKLITEISNVIELKNVEISYINTPFSGLHVFAYKSDGTFYDVYEYIDKLH